MLKRFLAASLMLLVSTQSAEALDLAAVKFKVRRAIALPVYVTAGFIAGPILGVITWKAVGKKEAEAAAIKKKLLANPLPKKEALEAGAK